MKEPNRDGCEGEDNHKLKNGPISTSSAANFKQVPGRFAVTDFYARRQEPIDVAGFARIRASIVAHPKSCDSGYYQFLRSCKEKPCTTLPGRTTD